MTNSRAAEEFLRLLDITDILLGPSGCPWDKEQTLVSMRASVLEEACEVIEAIDENNLDNLIEELGDLLYNIVFFCKLAEIEKSFITYDPIEKITEKLINRHPHVFGEKKVHDVESVLLQWDQIKKEEKKERESLMDGIPKGLPALARAYKVAGQMEKGKYIKKVEESVFHSEEELGEVLWELIRQARKLKINPELALRKAMVEEENSFRKWEKENTDNNPGHKGKNII